MPDQSLVALARANQVRSERKALKDRLARREILLDDVLEAPIPRYLETMRVFDLIAAAHMFGKTKAKRALRRLRIPEHRRLGALSKAQRKELLDFLIKHHPRALYGAAHRDYIC